jgi:predicted Zn-dependent protease
LNIQIRNAGRWGQFPVTLHLTYPEGMPDGDKEVVRAAVAEWQKMVDLTLVDQPDQARLELTWVTTLADNPDLGDTDWVATHPDSYGRIVVDKAIIRLLDPARYAEVVPGILKTIVMHQLGHALGINTHSDNDRDVMAEPAFRRSRNPMMQNAMRSWVGSTVGQLLGLPVAPYPVTIRRPAMAPPADKISKRDLNTLYRLYN